MPPGMTIDGIKEGISMPRNLVIARIFQMLGWVEQFGTGYLRIVKACEKRGYPLPEWCEIGPYFDVIFSSLRVQHMDKVTEQLSTKSGPSRDQARIRCR